MSILKSTNSGRGSVKLDVGYLTQRGYTYNHEYGFRRLYKDDNHFIIIDTVSKNDLYFSYYEQIEKYNIGFSFRLETVVDLEDLELYWQQKGVDLRNALKILSTNKNAHNSAQTVLLQIDIHDRMNEQFTMSINSRILNEMDWYEIQKRVKTKTYNKYSIPRKINRL